MRYTQNGLAIANFSVATSERVKEETRTEWHRIVAFDKLAEICGEYLRKGKLVYLEGRIQTRKWTDKDGVEKFTTEIVAYKMQMLGAKGDSDGEQKQDRPAPPPRQNPQPAPPQEQPRHDDDIPF